jgi:hypothetical protein
MASYMEKNMAKINNLALYTCVAVRKGMPGPRRCHPQDFDINISNKPNISTRVKVRH